MKSNLTYINAIPEDAELLTQTALDSKKSWGYSDELMNLWKSDLVVSVEYILGNRVVKIFDQDRFIGFFGIKMVGNTGAVIDHLWIIPNELRNGYGRLVFQHIMNYLKSNDHEKVTLIAEPNAKGFYDKMGGRIMGKFQSQVSGRVLDVYEFDLRK